MAEMSPEPQASQCPKLHLIYTNIPTTIQKQFATTPRPTPIMSTLFKKFTDVFTHGQDSYLLATVVLEEYKKITKKPTQATMIRDLKLDYIATIRRSKDRDLVGTIANVDVLNGFKSWSTINIYVKARQIKRNKPLMKLIDALPDINPDYVEEPDLEEEEAPAVAAPRPVHHDLEKEKAPAVATPRETRQSDDSADEYPIIELQDHEKFRDAETDEIVEIETRGARAQDKILFKAVDVEKYYEMARLVEIILNSNNAQYQPGRDYAILDSCSAESGRGNTNHNIVVIGKSPKRPDAAESKSGNANHNNVTIGKSPKRPDAAESKPTKQKYIKHDRVYLTLAGLLRVSMVSQSKNANLMKTVDWMIKIFYTHQFGSIEERQQLSDDLTKSILNDNLSGIYFIDIGSFSELYDTMSISREEYPPGTYDEYRIGKFGLTERDINTRLKEHQSTKSGYGRWSRKVHHKFSILISPALLPKAEKLLSSLLGAEDMSFPYVDVAGKQHKELIMVRPIHMNKVRAIYKQILTFFPSKENALAEQMVLAEERFEHQLLKEHTRLTEQITNRDAALAEKQLEMQLGMSAKDLSIRDEREKSMSARHESDILKLRLEMAEMKLAAK
jgi:hypothetical protein